MEYKKQVLFVWDDNGQKYLEELDKNPFGTKVVDCEASLFLTHPENFLPDSEHVVVAAGMTVIKQIIMLIESWDFSLAFLPLESQKKLIRLLDLSSKCEDNIETALSDDAKEIDLIKCNGALVEFKATIGSIPLIGLVSQTGKPWLFFSNLKEGVTQFFKIHLQQFEIETANGKKIKTAASGVFVLEHGRQSILSKMILSEHSRRDGQVMLVLVSPFSVIEYSKFLFSIITFSSNKKNLPDGIGIIKSREITVNAVRSKEAVLDENSSVSLPAKFKVMDKRLRINAGEKFWEENVKKSPDKETVKIDNLPDEKEMQKYLHTHIPFFSYASEERFKELFLSLRDDAVTNMHYVVLMILSTLLASIGLFANSSAVVIGAMLLAPLMAPIVSFSMGMLRADEKMLQHSLFKIAAGIVLALLASAGVAALLPELALTSEMRARINPNLLDMGVAVFSGVAAAYSKSFKEIAQSLAGVAIAVALVPPLSVAGIGLGQGNMGVFFGAFLLFFTNLVGISIAATLTFQILGFSSVVKSRKSMLIVSMLLIATVFPLFFSYNKIIQSYKMETFIKQSRFLVNDKYVIIKAASVAERGDVMVIDLTISVREALKRRDLEILKQKLQDQVEHKLFIRAQVEYIL